MNIKELQSKAHSIRQQTFKMCTTAGKGHLGGAFSITEILVGLYCSGLMRLSPKWRKSPRRDRVIFSKGHAGLALYVTLADLGFFPKKELLKYGKNGSMLGGHPDHFIPGVEVSSGSLGHGLSVAAGLALAAKLDKKDYLSIVILGDGECNEGSVWEAAAFAHQQKLNRLIAIVDNNGVGATDFTENYFGSPKLMAGRWKAFGWDVVEVNGHDLSKIIPVLKKLRSRKGDRPIAIIAHTVKGKGVSFMQNNHRWHHGVPKGDLLKKAKQELGVE